MNRSELDRRWNQVELLLIFFWLVVGTYFAVFIYFIIRRFFVT